MYRIKLVKSLVGLVIGFFIIRSVILPLIGFRGEETEIFSTGSAFAALKEDGSVVTWGDVYDGGDSREVSSQLQGGVTEIFSTERAFAALKEDGSVVTWGYFEYGGDK